MTCQTLLFRLWVMSLQRIMAKWIIGSSTQVWAQDVSVLCAFELCQGIPKLRLLEVD